MYVSLVFYLKITVNADAGNQCGRWLKADHKIIIFFFQSSNMVTGFQFGILAIDEETVLSRMLNTVRN